MTYNYDNQMISPIFLSKITVTGLNIESWETDSLLF